MADRPDPGCLLSLAPDPQDRRHQALSPAQVYCVGGAVRDALLGHASADRDYLVVGSSPEAMVAAGFRPVGRDFPVFLHPETHAEYALARTERKSGMGYHGFVFYAGSDVTLQDDLARRDLTVNAMAVDLHGQLHDPLHGQQDLERRVLRHVRAAFQEDPVRILRLARFAARWPAFTVADETVALVRSMVQAGEASALVAERVWQELHRGLSCPAPDRMVRLLVQWGAWTPATDSAEPSAALLDRLAATAGLSVTAELKAGLLFSEGSPGRLSRGLPREVMEWQRWFAQGLDRNPFVAREFDTPASWDVPQAVLAWLQKTDLYRRPERLSQIAQVLRPALSGQDHQRVEEALSLSVAEVAQKALAEGRPVPEAVAAHRLDQLRLALKTRNR